MNQQQMEHFFTQRQYTTFENFALGAEGIWPVCVVHESSLTGSTISLSIDVQQVPEQDIRQTLKEDVKAIHHCELGWTDDAVCVDLKPKDEQDLMQQWERLFSMLFDFFDTYHITPPTRCPVCDQEGCDILALYQAHFAPIHSVCLQRLMNEAEERAELQHLNGSYVTGLIGGILGGILGALPNLLLTWMAGRSHSLLFALIPLGIYYGYKLFRGKMNHIALVLTIGLSIIDFLLMNFVLLAISTMTQQNVNFATAWADTQPLLLDAKTWWDILKNSWFPFLCLATGTHAVWGRISRTASSEAQELFAILCSSVPNPAYQGPDEPSPLYEHKTPA